MAKQCCMCFQRKDTQSAVITGAPVTVCRSCNYKINSVVGFLEYHGIRLVYQPELAKPESESPPTPPKPKRTTKAKIKPSKPTKASLTT